MIVDSHCHLYDEKLNEIKNEILKNLENDDQVCICNGDNLYTSRQCIELANNNKNIFATVGVHPQEAKTFDDKVLVEFEKLIKANKKVVAIGEIGLDYFYETVDREIQKKVLIEQMEFALKMNLPCVFHVREAMGDFLEILENKFKDKNIRGVVHSFSGSVEVARILTKKGFYLGINGISTFKNANKILDVIKEIPITNLLIETDSPYLAPHPHRGKPNQPKYVEFVAEKIGEIKQISKQEVINETAKNAFLLFNIKR